MSTYKLSQQCLAHEQDVRSLCCFTDVQDSSVFYIITASRDTTVCVWKYQHGSFSLYRQQRGHSHFVNSVCYLGNSKYASGGHDKTINVWSIECDGAILQINGHEKAILCLAKGPKPNTLISGSADFSARVWDINTGSCLYTLCGHTHNVWAAVALDLQRPGAQEQQSSLVLTGSADKTIRLWHEAECLGVFKSHTDCVRSLAYSPEIGLLSSSNDGSVCLWDVLSGNSQKISVTDSFIYAVDVACASPQDSGQPLWACVSEDRALRLWHSFGAPTQVVVHPATVWSVCLLPNGDVATACSDGVLRIFSKEPDRIASKDVQAAFKASCAAAPVVAQSMGNGKYPGPEALATPGSREGEHRIIQEDKGSAPAVYIWSVGESTWQKIGTLTDGSGSSEQSMLDGKFYDQIISVELDGRHMKLGVNKGDNPYMVAQEFIWKHDLNQEYLQQIAEFVTTHMGPAMLGADPSSSSTAGSDPLTGSHRYIPGANPPPSSPYPTSQSVLDPISGQGAYTTTAQNPSAAGTKPTAFSSKPYPPPHGLLFGSIKFDAVLKKMIEFSSQMPQHTPESETVMTDIFGKLGHVLPSPLTASSWASWVSSQPPTLSLPPPAWQLLLSTLAWPVDQLFPAVDCLRVAVCLPGCLLAPQFAQCFRSLLQQFASAQNLPHAYTLTSLYLIANTATVIRAHSSPSLSLHTLFPLEDVSKLLDRLPLLITAEAKRAVVLAAVTVVMNLTLVLEFSEDQVLQLLAFLHKVLDEQKEPEVVYRGLVALGSLTVDSSLVRELITGFDFSATFSRIIDRLAAEERVKTIVWALKSDLSL